MKFFVLITLGLVTSMGQDASSSAKVALKAGLYPFIPDPAGDSFVTLDNWVKSTFGAAHPNINLNLSPTSGQTTIYNATVLQEMLTTGGFDVLQFDSMYLNEIANTGLLNPLTHDSVDTDTWTPQAILAATVNGTLYAQPQWHCGYFSFTRDPSVFNAINSEQLLRALARQRGPNQKFGTSWDLFDLTVVYLAGVAQNAGAANAQAAVNLAIQPGQPIHHKVSDVLTQLTTDCINASDYNPCPYYDYSYSSLMFSDFATDGLDTMMYYSEELNPVALASPSGLTDVLFTVTPIGDSKTPFLTYTDVTVISRACQNRPGCFAAALQFAAFTWSNTFFDYVLRSKDAIAVNGGPQPLRYLMPATLDAFEVDQVDDDSFYHTIKTALLGNSHTPPSIIIPNSISTQADRIYAKLICMVTGQTPC